MKGRLVIFIFTWFIMQSLMANDKEIEIIEQNKLEDLTNQMETYFENENMDSTSFYIQKIESLSNLEKFKNYYLNSVVLKAKMLFRENRYKIGGAFRKK